MTETSSKWIRKKGTGIQKQKEIQLCEIEWKEKQYLPLFQYPAIEDTGIVKHGFSTRLGGVSEGIFSTLNLSFSRGDDRAAVEENYRRLAVALDVKYESFVFSDQTHTTNVVRVSKEDAGNGLLYPQKFKDVDGMICKEPGVTLTTFYADCVPLFFIDPVQKAIGLSHSGWRGTVGKMGAETIRRMGVEFRTKPEDLICAIGPSICQDCYEISEDVAEEFKKAFKGKEKQLLISRENHKYQLDLWKANEIVLMEAGVLKEHITTTNICTCCNPTLLFSHRASQGKRGNLGAFLAIKE